MRGEENRGNAFSLLVAMQLIGEFKQIHIDELIINEQEIWFAPGDPL